MLMCNDLEKTHTEHLETTPPKINKHEDEHLENFMAKKGVAGATSGLNSFLLKSGGISGNSLFRHMV